MADKVVTDLFQKAQEIREEKEDLFERQNATRSALRNLDDAGVLTDAQSKELEEIWPRRQRRANGTDDEG
jgi:hypothetical protein